MSAFDRLHPAVQHHIVNSLGWSSLRPLQEQSIGPILDGRNALMLAPTAGGKTEAAFLPLLSRMLTEGWSGLSVLYVCPIRALLNNLEPRLGGYSELVGRRCGLWHGDVSSGARRRILDDPPDVLLTTPESIEVMLVSRKSQKERMFGTLRAVVVDELHAFAGDDRGWHLLALLERLTRIAGRDVQRIGLSATIGNPEALIGWLEGSSKAQATVVAPEASVASKSEVEIDYVGSLGNAATVISRLHQGEKRLVFCDSRARVEELSSSLRQLEVQTFVSHGSLGVDERRRAEEAFREGANCVIVATSTLELGIDVGDLDRVIQIDAPGTVSGFLQRMGRTGRREGTQRNCLFLTTSRGALLRAAALVRLWREGYVEPVVPPQKPYHVIAQQLMALALQEKGVGRRTWAEWLGARTLDGMRLEIAERIVGHMLSSGILFDDDGLLWFAEEGERKFGRKNFLELVSVFYSPPLFKVMHGRVEIGQVHELSFLVRSEQSPVLLLGGRSWATTQIDWTRRVAYVKPVEDPGRSRWLGEGAPLSNAVARSVRTVLADRIADTEWSRRAGEELAAAREAVPWVVDGETTVLFDANTQANSEATWWTFGGARANTMLANALESALSCRMTSDSFQVRADGLSSSVRLIDAIHILKSSPPSTGPEDLARRALENLKFSSCLPNDIALDEAQTRLADVEGAQKVLREPVVSVV